MGTRGWSAETSAFWRGRHPPPAPLTPDDIRRYVYASLRASGCGYRTPNDAVRSCDLRKFGDMFPDERGGRGMAGAARLTTSYQGRVKYENYRIIRHHSFLNCASAAPSAQPSAAWDDH